MTGLATAIYENETGRVTDELDAKANAAILDHMGEQLAGVEELEGTYPFTLARSVKGYRLNKFLHDLIVPPSAICFWRIPRPPSTRPA